MIYRVAVIGAETRPSIFPIDKQALPNADREWRWMTISVATEFSADESHGQTNRRRQTRPRLSQIQTRNRSRLAQSRGPNRGRVEMSRERSRLMVILKNVAHATVTDRSGPERGKERRTPSRVTNNQ
jgi:hypothetical protein